MRKGIKILLVCIILCLPMSGCIKSTSPEGVDLYRLDPNSVASVEAGVSLGAMIFQLLGEIWLPGLSGVAVSLLSILATWRKIKPQLTEAQTEGLLYYTLGSVTVEGIEAWKELNPDDWEKLKAELEKIKDRLLDAEDRKKIDNLIRGLSGKPPRE